MPLFGDRCAGWGVHEVFEEEDLFVEVVEGGALEFAVVGGRVDWLGLFGRVVEGAVFAAAEGEGAGDAYRAQGVEAVGILHDVELLRGVGASLVQRMTEGHVFDYEQHLVDHLPRHLVCLQKVLGNRVVVLRFSYHLSVTDVVEQDGQVDDELVGLLLFVDGPGVVVHPLDMPPIMPRPLPHEGLLYKEDCFFEYCLFVHTFS